MKWSELPKEYQDLEKKFRSFCYYEKDFKSKNIDERFRWIDTPQGKDFWWFCHASKSIADLPLITITDYPDTKEPEKKERYFIVFWDKPSIQMGIDSIATKGAYLNLKRFESQKENKGKCITNIIELNEQDYNDFIK